MKNLDKEKKSILNLEKKRVKGYIRTLGKIS